MLSEVTREDELNGSLNIVRADSVSALTSVELRGLKGDSFEEVNDETVHDAHGSLGDSDLIVDVLEDSVNVDAVAVESLSSGSASLGSLRSNFLGWSLAGHFDLYVQMKGAL